MNNTFNPLNFISNKQVEQIMKSIDDLMMEELKNKVPFRITNINLASKSLSI